MPSVVVVMVVVVVEWEEDEEGSSSVGRAMATAGEGRCRRLF